MIGVAISTCNRRDLALDSIKRWRRRLPPQAILVVVDDASDSQLSDIDGATIRHDYRRGVAMTKNAGIAALIDAGCDHLFLADDDIHPTTDDWWQPYINSPEQHLSWQWETREPWLSRYDDGTHWAIGFPRGVLLYATREVVNTVGGMDIAYGVHGGEHVEWQQRIHDAKFGIRPFMDVHGTSERFWSYDKEQGGTEGSTIPLDERRGLIEANAKIWDKPRATFLPYREGEGTQDFQLGPKLADTFEGVLDHILTMRPHGAAVEFGVGEGHSLRRIAQQMPAYGFDSFDGLPEDWEPGRFEKGHFACEQPTAPNATIIPGWFAATLPSFDFAELGHIGLWHLDADLYSSTMTILDHIGPHLESGAYLVFDEWHGASRCVEHEQRAFREWAAGRNLGWSVVGHGPEQWAVRIA